jgi:hypothetical protein
MKLKKIRVRLKDIHHGKILYVAHPACGIVRVQVVGKPRVVMLGAVLGLKGSPRLFIDTIPLDYDWWDCTKTDPRSLSDMGVYNMYGYRRTFHTRKQAERYVATMKHAPEFVKQWNDHIFECEMLDDMYPDTYHYES